MTTYTYKQACIFGGTGFLGRQIVRRLAEKGYTVKVATRSPAKAYFLRTAGKAGQVVPVSCDIGKDESLRDLIRGCDIVINCIGILYEKSRGAFEKIHAELPQRIAAACASEKTERFIQISALGCDTGKSDYAKTKLAGEKNLLARFPDATILRPSVMFGPEDNFFNMFAKLSVVLPALPLIGGGKTKFQPVYVGDVAAAVDAVLDRPDTKGKTYELGGPETVTFKNVLERLAVETGRKRFLLNIPWPLAKLDGKILSLLPNPPLTADQVVSLQTDNVVAPGAEGFTELGIAPEPMDTILPTYLGRFKSGGRFADKKRA